MHKLRTIFSLVTTSQKAYGISNRVTSINLPCKTFPYIHNFIYLNVRFVTYTVLPPDGAALTIPVNAPFKVNNRLHFLLPILGTLFSMRVVKAAADPDMIVLTTDLLTASADPGPEMPNSEPPLKARNPNTRMKPPRAANCKITCCYYSLMIKVCKKRYFSFQIYTSKITI